MLGNSATYVSHLIRVTCVGRHDDTESPGGSQMLGSGLFMKKKCSHRMCSSAGRRFSSTTQSLTTELPHLLFLFRHHTVYLHVSAHPLRAVTAQTPGEFADRFILSSYLA